MAQPLTFQAIGNWEASTAVIVREFVEKATNIGEWGFPRLLDVDRAESPEQVGSLAMT
jgi:hypothetical protein